MKPRTLVAVAALGALAAAAAVAVVVTSDHVTGKAATLALAIPTGLAFVGSGLAARARRPTNRTGVLLIMVGFAWFLTALPASDNAVLFTAGFALVGLFIGFLAHLFLAFPSGRLSSGLDRGVAIAMYVFVAAFPAALLVFDEGDISETGCETGAACPENLLATVPAQEVATTLAVVYALGAGSLAVVVAVRLARRWRGAPPALRSALNPIVATAAVLIGAFAAQIVAGFFSQPLARAINWVVLVAMLAVPLSFLYGLLRPRLTASARRLAAELSEARGPEQVQAVLRRAVRDPTLELGHRGAADEAYVRVDGGPLELPLPGGGREVTAIGDGIIVHDASLRDQPELDEVLDAARIALERGLTLRSLEASERRTRALLDAIPDNMYRISRDGTFLDFHARNPTALNVPASTLIGRNVRDVMPPELREPMLAALARACDEGTMQVIQYELERPGTGPELGLRRLESRAVRSAEDEVVVIVRDVTELKENEEALRALLDEQEALSRVATTVVTEQRPEAVFAAVTEEVAKLLGAEWGSTVRLDEHAEEAIVVGRWHATGDFEFQLGTRFRLQSGAVSRVKETGQPARVTYSLDADPRRRQTVAAPIVVSGRLWGAATVSKPEPGSFPADAEERLGKFTSLVAAAIANAEAHERLAALAEEQAALTRVAVTVATQVAPEEVFRVAVEEVGRLLDAAAAHLIRFTEDPARGVLVGQWSGPELSLLGVGDLVSLDGGPITDVRGTGESQRIEYADAERPQFFEGLGVTCELAAPVSVFGELWGAIGVATTAEASFPEGTERRLASFAELVGLAVTNAEVRKELAASRARIVRAGDEERQRLERNLHDGAQQRLVTLALGLRLAQSRLEADPAGARALLESAATELAQALEELRELARGLHPAILTDRGLGPALESLARRAPVPVELADITCGRFPPAVEAAAYYVVAESLTNVAKYADAQAARVRVDRQNGLAIVEVEDDGVGGADASRGTGLRGLADRVEALDGLLTVSSAPGRGTRVRAEIPLVDTDEE